MVLPGADRAFQGPAQGHRTQDGLAPFVSARALPAASGSGSIRRLPAHPSTFVARRRAAPGSRPAINLLTRREGGEEPRCPARRCTAGARLPTRCREERPVGEVRKSHQTASVKQHPAPSGFDLFGGEARRQRLAPEGMSHGDRGSAVPARPRQLADSPGLPGADLPQCAVAARTAWVRGVRRCWPLPQQRLGRPSLWEQDRCRRPERGAPPPVKARCSPSGWTLRSRARRGHQLRLTGCTRTRYPATPRTPTQLSTARPWLPWAR